METALILTALGLGFASGFHCVGMCGPIALSLGLSGRQGIRFYVQNLTYQFGRALSYSLLGAALGILGKGFSMAGFQSYLSIFAGLLLIIMALFSFGKKDFATQVPVLNNLLLKIKMGLGKLLKRADLKSRFFTGVLNGLLPCGAVYMGLTASLAAGGIWQGAAFMALFGLGTIPFMFGVVLAGGLMSQTFRLKALKVIPVVMIVLGGLFILRGLEMGIPYLSPKKEALQVIHNDSPDHHKGDHSSCH